jgi:hypothetical protein
MPRGSSPGERRGGRQKGSKNKPKLSLAKQLAAERSEARARAKAFEKREAEFAKTSAEFEMALEKEEGLKMPLDVMLDFMRDETNPPGFRGEMAKAAAVYCHSKAPEAQPERVVHITEIRHIIVEPKHSGTDLGHILGEGIPAVN